MEAFLDGHLEHMGQHFDVFEWSTIQLYGIALGMLYSVMAPQLLDIELVELLDFIVDVDRSYLSENPYHNFRHAMDVTFVLFHMLNDLDLVRYFIQMDLMILLLSGLCHDICHPGLNNMYQVNGRTDLALLYNDKSVLENYSVSQTLNFFGKHNLLRNLDQETDEMYLRETLSAIILYTDMAEHFTLTKEFAQCVDELIAESKSGQNKDYQKSTEQLSSGPIPETSIALQSDRPTSGNPAIIHRHPGNTPKFERPSQLTVQLPLCERHRLVFMKVFMHAADISNPCRPFPICRKWTTLVAEEFYNQGDAEKRNGLPLSPNMDRETGDPIRMTLGFSEVIVKPFFEAISNFVKEFSEFCDQLKSNKEDWAKLQQTMSVPTSEGTSSNDSLSSATQPTILQTTQLPPLLVSDMRKVSTMGRRMSFAAGVFIMPDEKQQEELNKSALFHAPPKEIKFKFASAPTDPVPLGSRSSKNSKTDFASHSRSFIRLDKKMFSSETTSPIMDPRNCAVSLAGQRSSESQAEEYGLRDFVLNRRRKSSVPSSAAEVATALAKLASERANSPEHHAPKSNFSTSKVDSEQSLMNSSKKLISSAEQVDVNIILSRESIKRGSTKSNTNSTTSTALSHAPSAVSDGVAYRSNREDHALSAIMSLSAVASASSDRLFKPHNVLHQYNSDVNATLIQNMLTRCKIESAMAPNDSSQREVIRTTAGNPDTIDSNYNTIHYTSQIYDQLVKENTSKIPPFSKTAKLDEMDTTLESPKTPNVLLSHAGLVQMQPERIVDSSRSSSFSLGTRTTSQSSVLDIFSPLVVDQGLSSAPKSALDGLGLSRVRTKSDASEEFRNIAENKKI